jgi:hypothetical protein
MNPMQPKRATSKIVLFMVYVVVVVSKILIELSSVRNNIFFIAVVDRARDFRYHTLNLFSYLEFQGFAKSLV